MMANPFPMLYLAEFPKIKFDIKVRWQVRKTIFLFQFYECYASLVDESSGGVILIVICAIFQSISVLLKYALKSP